MSSFFFFKVPGPGPASAWVYSDRQFVPEYRGNRTLVHFKSTASVQSEYILRKSSRVLLRWGMSSLEDIYDWCDNTLSNTLEWLSSVRIEDLRGKLIRSDQRLSKSLSLFLFLFRFNIVFYPKTKKEFVGKKKFTLILNVYNFLLTSSANQEFSYFKVFVFIKT